MWYQKSEERLKEKSIDTKKTKSIWYLEGKENNKSTLKHQHQPYPETLITYLCAPATMSSSL